jgi:nanoRNase/pAp phosphatase (c-di-AMP/oligoRNAs hydrolase)
MTDEVDATEPPKKSDKKSEKTSTKKNGIEKLGQELASKAEEKDSKVAIFTHRMPDPDAVSSMMGMKWLLLRKYELESDLFYEGEIAHPQNMTMCNLLDPSLQRINDGSYDSVKYNYRILCDTVPANAGTGEFDVIFDLVIDHHKDVPHDFKGIMIHRKYGSCAAIVYQIIKELLGRDSDNWFDDDLDYDMKVATALLAGVSTDCFYCLADEATESDREAVNELFPYRNSNFLQQVISFKRPKFWVQKKAEGCQDCEVTDEGCAIVGLGLIPDRERDLIADMAEEMVSWATVESAVAFGVVGGDRIEGSVRSNNASISVPELCKKLGGKHGSGGGKHGKGAYRSNLAGMSIDPDEDPDDVNEAWESIKKREAKRIKRLINK